VFSVVHALTAGSDRHSVYLRAGVMAAVAVVAGLTLARIALPLHTRSRELEAQAAWR